MASILFYHCGSDIRDLFFIEFLYKKEKFVFFVECVILKKCAESNQSLCGIFAFQGYSCCGAIPENAQLQQPIWERSVET